MVIFFSINNKFPSHLKLPTGRK